jgi:ATP-dependent Lon protease
MKEDPFFVAKITPLPEKPDESMQAQALMRTINSQFKQYVNLGKNLPTEVIVAASNVKEAGMLADLVASHIAIDIEQRQQILETVDQVKRLELVSRILGKEIQLLNMSNKIQNQVQEEVGKSQREYFLREQMKAIQKELGEVDEKQQEKDQYEKKIEAAKMPQEAKDKALEELKRLERMHPESAESAVVRTYLDILCALPWSIESADEVDIKKAEHILNEDHYGLERVKERLLEFLGVLKIKKSLKGPILCFVGPPGVGKTSLGKSIARALGRKFTRLSLGGVRDEAEIRGFRRTYVGALPGRIIQSIKTIGTRNPVFMLDEIDKLGADFRGDPSAALLEALDPEQNFSFSDHYLEVPFDLSKVLFIATANMLDTIPPALLDRMEVLTLPGYTELEKVKIAKKFLIPRQRENHGLKASQVKFDDGAIKRIILYYTREAGLRNLEREIASICRKVALTIAKGDAGAVAVHEADVEKYLGVRRFDFDEERRRDEVGVVTGLAWTPVGGDTLIIEASFMNGKGSLILTGQLGDVMQESCKAALTYARSNAKKLGIEEALFENKDIHIHFPAGATPKDGPSAGVTIATAIVSLLTGTPVSSKLAMTGEITLKGRVLPIGGLKEKLLAAKRMHIHTVIAPLANKKDMVEVPDEIKRDLDVKYVNTIDEVLGLALVNHKWNGQQPVVEVARHQKVAKKAKVRGK